MTKLWHSIDQRNRKYFVDVRRRLIKVRRKGVPIWWFCHTKAYGTLYSDKPNPNLSKNWNMMFNTPNEVFCGWDPDLHRYVVRGKR